MDREVDRSSVAKSAVGPWCVDWPFTGPEGPITVRVSGGFIANNSAIVNVAARSGHRIALLPEFQVIDDLRAGRLFRLPDDYPSQLFQCTSSIRRVATLPRGAVWYG